MKHYKKNARYYASTMALVTAMAAAPQAFAQSSSDTRFDNIDEVIVTARKREESIQEVPLAITAFNAESFVKKNIQSLDDVARLTPGLSFEDFTGGFSTPVIRGQSQTRITALEQNVSAFLDGVYIPRSWAIDLGTLNLDRIEVVKGPQSSRYGRNAFAGAINYVPFKATVDDSGITGSVTGTVGSDERLDGGVKVKISDDFIAAAFSYDYSTSDGTWDNTHAFADLDLDEGTEGNAGGWDNNSFSASVAIEPTDSLSIEASWNRFDVENEARAGQNNDESAGALNCGSSIIDANGIENFRLFCGELPAAPDQANLDPRNVGVISETDIFRASANLSISEDLDLSYTFGSVEGEVFTGGSSDTFQENCFPNFNSNLNRLFTGIPIPGDCVFTFSPVGSIDYTSHELRAVYTPNETWRIEAGAFLSDGDDVNETAFGSVPVLSADVATQQTARSFASSILMGGDRIETDSTSFFGAVEWTGLEGALRLGAEVRYTEDDITGSSLSGANAEQNDTFSFVTPRFTADYQVNDDSLLYASVARGAKSGGFNPSAIQDPTNPELFADNLTFDPETNWTFELGSKNKFFDNRATLNGAIFYTDWKGLQLNASDPGATGNVNNITLNLGDARVFGIELDGAFNITDNFSIDGTFSFVDNEYKDGTIDTRFATPASAFFANTIQGAFGTPVAVPPFFIPTPTPTPCDDVVCSSAGDIGGNQIERTPDTQLTLGAEYGSNFGNDVEWFVRGDLSWQSEFFATPVNLATIPDRTLISATAGINYQNVDITVWAKNLTDEQYVSNSFAVIIPFGNAYNTFFGDRRSYGLTAKYNF